MPPTDLTTAPDTYVGSLDPATPAASLTPAAVTVADIGCTADQTLVAGEIGDLTVSLRNACAGAVSGIDGTLTVLSPGVSVLQAAAAYPDLAPGATGAGATPFRIRLDDAYPCGDPIRLRLDGTSNAGAFGFAFTVPTGMVVKDTLLLAEGFESVPTGLPAGWSHLQRKGVANPWEVSASLASAGARSVHCVDYPDTNWSRLDSPLFTVPPDADLLEVTFAVTYDMEAVGDGRQGYDGALLKIQVDGRDVLAGAFSTLFEGQYRTQIVRSSGDLANPLQDLAAWCGNTLPNFEPIRIQYPGLAGRSVRLVYEAGADGSMGGTGVYVDDVRVRALTLGCGACTAQPVLAVSPTGIVFPELRVGVEACTTVTVKNTGDGFLHIQSITGADPACRLDLSGLATELLPGDSTSFSACITESDVGPDTCEVHHRHRRRRRHGADRRARGHRGGGAPASPPHAAALAGSPQPVPLRHRDPLRGASGRPRRSRHLRRHRPVRAHLPRRRVACSRAVPALLGRPRRPRSARRQRRLHAAPALRR